MNTPLQSQFRRGHGSALKQRGVVLFFTLIALVVMSLAAVALIRSVDTSTMISGNLAFRQAGTSSGDSGIEAAIAWLSSAQAEAAKANLNVYKDTTHPFNHTGGYDINGGTCCLNAGYYSNADLSLSLTDPTASNRINWTSDSTLVLDPSGNQTDNSGNTVRYVIQRLSRTADKLPGTIEIPPTITGTIFSSAALDNSGKQIPYATEVCPPKSTGCPSAGMTALMRITVRVSGPKNTVSYVQTIVY
jgi:type IV pilus assembly protein PilX